MSGLQDVKIVRTACAQFSQATHHPVIPFAFPRGL